MPQPTRVLPRRIERGKLGLALQLVQQRRGVVDTRVISIDGFGFLQTAASHITVTLPDVAENQLNASFEGLVFVNVFHRACGGGHASTEGKCA